MIESGAFVKSRWVYTGCPRDSVVRRLRFRKDHVLFRPYSPRGFTAGGLWLERNPNHPKIWGWVLAADANSDLDPGVQLVVKRCMGELVGTERPTKELYPGHRWEVIALPINAIALAINPPLVRMEAA
jgi:hypothetical protein